jgi:PKD repeat protein
MKNSILTVFSVFTYWFLPIFVNAQPCNVTLNSNPVNAQICSGQSATLTAGGANTYVWSPATGLSATNTAVVTATPLITTTYTVTGTCAGGSTGTQNITVVIKPNPTASFTVTPSGVSCGSTPLVFNGNAAGGGGGPYSYAWAFGDGGTGTGQSKTHSYVTAVGTATQNFNASLTVLGANGCSGVATQVVTVNQIPSTTVLSSASTTIINGITYYTDCQNNPATLTFINSSTTIANNTNYSINWGDGSANFTGASWTTLNHTYTTGIYNIIYNVTGSNGCVAKDTLHIFIGSTPAVGIGTPGNTVICAPANLTFPITGTSSNPSGTTYTVTVNDGSPSVSFNHPPPSSVTHNFTTSSCNTTSSNGAQNYPNSYSVSIVATNPCGTSAGSVLPIYVSSPPNAGISVVGGSDHCVNTAVSINDFTTEGYNVSAQGNCTQNYKMIWSISPAVGWTSGSVFGTTNGATNTNLWVSGTASLSVNFNTTGTYTVTLITGNQCGKDTTTYPICIVDPILPSFTVDNIAGCSPLVVNTTNTSVMNGGCSTFGSGWSIWTYSSFCGSNSYSFTGGSSSGTASPQFTFFGTGSYQIRLAASNVCGTYYAYQNVNVQSAPSSITFNPINGACNVLTVNPSYIINGCDVAPITGYNWTFAGGTPASANTASASSTFNTVGNHLISLIVTNACGSATGSVNAPVYGDPIADAGNYFTICDNTTSSMSGSASAGNGGYNYSWSPTTGLGFTSSCCPTVSVNNTTLYTLSVTDVYGCTDSDTVTVFVNPSPNVSMTANPSSICLGDTIFLSALGASSYSWSGNGLLSSSSANVLAISNSSGFFNYSVTGSNLFNCSNSDNASITVNPIPNLSVNPSLSNFICVGQSQNLSANGANTYVWSPATGLNTTTGSNVIATPLVTTTYKLVGTSAFGCKDSVNVIVNVNGTPNVQATVATIPICPGQSTTITASGASSYTWSPAATLSASTGQIVTASPMVTTSYILTGINGASCQDTVHVTVVVQPGINFNITHTDSTICNGQTNDTINVSGGSNFTWSPALGLNTTIGNTVIATPTVTTTYTVTGLNLIGCTVVNSTVVTVNNLPIISAGNNTTICYGLNTTIGSASQINMNYSWTPITGLSNPLMSNPVAAPTVTTTYYLLQTNSITGCYSNDSVVITVVPLPPPPSLSSNSPICWSAGYTLFASGAVGASYSWLGPNGFSSSIQNPTIPLAFYADTGNYTCTQFFAGCSSIPDTIHLSMFAPPAALSGLNATICLGQSAPIGATAVVGSTYVWTSTPAGYANINSSDIVTPLVTTTYTIHETDINTCQDSNNVVITVMPLPIVAFTNNPIACLNVGTLFTNNTTGAASYVWDFGDGTSSGIASPNHAYTNTGTYIVTLVATTFFSCVDSIKDTITVVTTPTSNFSMSTHNGCGPLPVNFINNSSGYQATYSWYMGNGQTYNGVTPPTTTYPLPYAHDSTFIIQLTSSNLCGNTIMIDSVIVHPAPHVDFGTFPWSGCSPITFPFLNSSVGLPTSFLWLWGDGTSTPALPNPSNPMITHSYTIPGPNDSTFTISLIGTNNCGSDTTQHSVLVHPHGVFTLISASDSVGCAPLTVNFTAYIAGANSIGWNFGNGNFSTNPTSTQVFNTPGAYDVYLFADDGCSFDTSHLFIFVNPNPNINFTMTDDTICAGESILFSNNTPNLNNITWHFGDGFSGANSFQSHAYSTGGVYNVTLVGTSATYGCTDSTSQIVNVIGNPNISIGANQTFGCSPLTVAFNNTTSFVSFHQWNFGDGNSSNNFAPTHTYTVPGVYSVQYVAVNLNGCNDTGYISINVFPKPIAGFLMNSSDACFTPGNVTILNSSSGANTFSWFDGAGNISNNTNVNFTYNSPGTYNIMLIASNTYGCSDTAFNQFILYPTPIAGFYASPLQGCAPLAVSFADTSANSVYYAWSFGDGEFATNTPTIVHTYDSAGIYSVSLKIEGINHVCADSISKTDYITVYPKPKADFTINNLNTVEPDVKVVYTNASSSIANLFNWNMGDNSNWLVTNDTVIPYSYTSYGTYLVTLIAITPNGCSDTISKDNLTGFHSGLYVPNAMMPTSGTNQEVKVFQPKGIGMASYHVEIFTTWGEKIWDSNKLDQHGSPAEAWDGSFKGDLMPQDVYVWKIDATFKDQKNWRGNTYDTQTYSKTGSLSLIR